MWYPAKISTSAAAEPVTLAEAKRHVNADEFIDDDGELGLLVAAARDYVEKYTGTRLATQTVAAKCDCFADFSRFPEAPAQSVTSIEYIDTSGATQSLADTVYELRSEGLETSIVLKYGQSWPAIRPKSRIAVTAVVGYNEVPPAVKHALLLWLSAGYETRENAKADGWTTFDCLLANFRRG